MRAWFPLLFTAALACGGKTEVGGKPVGSCTFASGEWTCTSTDVDAAATSPQTLPACPGNVGAGGVCATGDNTVDTTNPTVPAHYGNAAWPPCFGCTSNGLGVVWTCTSQGWEAGDVLSCAQ